MKPLTLIVALTVTALSARAAQATTVVACVGDSITQNSGWPDRLGVRLGANYQAKNFGVSGTTLLKNGDFPYWNTTAFTASHTSNPGIVVIMLGTNDSKPQNWGAHMADFVGDYEALIDSYAALPSHPQIWVNLCPPAGVNGFGISGTVIETQINPLIRQVALAKGVGLIDIFSAFGGHNFDPSLYGSPGDQVHPNATGAQRIADTVYAALSADAGVPYAAPEGGAPQAVDASDDTTTVDALADAGVAAIDALSEDGTSDAAMPADATAASVGEGATVSDSATARPQATQGDAAIKLGPSSADATSVGASLTQPASGETSGCAFSGLPRGAASSLDGAWLIVLVLAARARQLAHGGVGIRLRFGSKRVGGGRRTAGLSVSIGSAITGKLPFDVVAPTGPNGLACNAESACFAASMYFRTP
jgi:lysophospholipase L1-like esterase